MAVGFVAIVELLGHQNQFQILVKFPILQAPASLNGLRLPRAAAEVSLESSGFCGQSCGRQIAPTVITGSSREGDGQVGLTVHLSFSDCKTSHFSI